MKRYKLIKDLPTFKAGDEFYVSEGGSLIYDNGDTGIVAYAQTTLDKFPDILTEWFEEIKESVDSIHWKPEFGDIYWSLGISGIVQKRKWSPLSDDLVQFDLGSHEIGNCYRTEEGCEHAQKVQIARTKIRRSSNFVPDWRNKNQLKYYVTYDYANNCLHIRASYDMDSGAIVYYETKEDTELAIENLEPEYLLHFGVEKQ